MRYDDLLGLPYKPKGRSKEGFDCYGLVIECCNRCGLKLNDLYYERQKISQDNDYIRNGLNVEKIDGPEKYCVVEMHENGHLHCGFMVDRKHVIHATMKKGVILEPLQAVEAIAFYRVKNDN